MISVAFGIRASACCGLMRRNFGQLQCAHPRRARLGSGAVRQPPVNAVTRRRSVIDHLYLAKSYCHIRRGDLIITSSQDAALEFMYEQ